MKNILNIKKTEAETEIKKLKAQTEEVNLQIKQINNKYSDNIIEQKNYIKQFYSQMSQGAVLSKSILKTFNNTKNSFNQEVSLLQEELNNLQTLLNDLDLKSEQSYATLKTIIIRIEKFCFIESETLLSNQNATHF